MSRLAAHAETKRPDGSAPRRSEGARSDRLHVGEAGDAFEHEASRAAEQALARRGGRDAAAPVLGAAAPARSSTPVAAPASVERVLTGHGSALPSALRREMEQGFGQDFSRVRLHAGAAAEHSARELRADAYAVGPHLVFGAGRFQPSTAGGRQLIAHELAHTLQPGSQLVRRAPETGQPAAATTAGATTSTPAAPPRQATPEERREFAREALRFLQRQIEYFTLQPDRELGQVLRAYRESVRGALTILEGDSSATALADQIRATYRDAVRARMSAATRAAPGAVRTPPTMQQLWERHRDDVLPFVLPQSSVDPSAGELSAELEAPLPDQPTAAERTRHRAIAAARQRLRVITASIDLQIGNLFSTRGGTTTIPLPEHTTARLSSNIPAALHRGLQNVAGELIPTPLVANSTVQLALDLTPYGGGYDAYRFTHIDLGRLGKEVLIERQGAIGVEGLTTEQRRPLQERFDRLGFVRSGFSTDEFDQVLIGVAEVPEARLSTLRGLRFERDAADPQHPDAAAHYDQRNDDRDNPRPHAVVVFDHAFRSSSLTRMGRAGHVLSYAAHAVTHELGHALDLDPLRTTAAASGAAQRALLAEFGTGGTGYSIPHPQAPERARYDVLQGGVTTAATAERAARSRSGARWTSANPSTVSDNLVQGARQPAFRQAAISDGGPAGRQFPTDYPHPVSVWQEYFAESFALYQNSPDLLRRMRPNVYAYMAREFPR